MELELFESLLEYAVGLTEGQNQFPLGEFCFDQQLKFIEDKAPFKAAVCSRRAGKTTACAAHLIHEAVSKPNRICLYVTLSRLNAKRIIWNELTQMNQRFELGGEPNETELSITFPNGSTIYLSGAKDKSEIEKFRGIAISLCYIDEAQSFRPYIRELIDDVIGPALMDYAGTLCLIGTPGPVPAGYFYEVAAQSSSSWAKHGWTFWDNPHIARKAGVPHQTILNRELERRGVNVEDPSIQREWFGRWIVDIEALVFKYDAERNHFERAPRIDQMDTIIGIDVGFDDSDAIAVIGWPRHQKISYLLEERIEAKQGITELAGLVENLIKTYKPMRIVMDTGGLGKKIAEEIRKRYSIPIQAAEKSRKFEFIELLNDAMRTARFLARKDSAFAHDCMMVEWDQDKRSPDKLKISDRYHSDICDAVLYAWREALHWLSEPEAEIPNLRDPKQYITHTEKLMREQLERQIARQEAAERAEDSYAMAEMDLDENPLKHYLNKRRK